MKKFLTLLSLIMVMLASLTVFTACGGDPGNGTGGNPPHTCSFTQCVAESRYLAKIADCTTPAMYYKSCTCGLTGGETFAVGEPLGHNWSKSDSLFDGTKRHARFCYNCSERVIEDCVGSVANCITDSTCLECGSYVSGYDYTNHFISTDPTNSGISKSNGDGTKHEITCNFCNHLVEYEDCYGGEATCTMQATCEGCNNRYGTVDATAHRLNDEWLGKIDGKHAKSCSNCYQDIIVENCDFSNATCSERGYCSKCHSNGDYDYDNHVGETEWVISTYEHYTRWACCGNLDFIDEGNVPFRHDWDNGHCTTCNYDCLHSGGVATCSTLATCEICNSEYGDFNINNHTGQGQWEKTKTSHSFRYDCCGNYSIENVDHDWVNEGVCWDCEYECGHEGGIATCTNRAQCDICERYYGERDLDNHDIVESWLHGNVGLSNQYHYYTCSYGCGGYFNSSECGGGVATCSSPALCTICSAPHGEIDLNNHNIAENFTSNGNGTHYKACTYGCSNKYDEAMCYGGVATCSSPALCDDCGGEHGELDINNHDIAETFTSAGDGTHYKACTYGCSTRFASEDCFGGIATCNTLALCDDCHAYYGDLDANNHNVDPSYTFTDNYTHTIDYACCPTHLTVNHDWINGKCETCLHECLHSGGTATCSTKAKCDYCDERYGEFDDTTHNMVGNECTGCHTLTVSQGLQFSSAWRSGVEYWYLAGRGTNTDKNLVLPETTYDGHPYEFPLNGISGDTLLESVTAHGLVEIDFRNCPNLKKIDLSAIGSISIWNCPNLEEVVIGGTVGELDISEATALKTVTFKPNTTINSIGISNSPYLTSLDLSGLEIKTLDYGAFANNARLSELNLGDTVETIRYSAFENCMSLTKIVIPESVTSIVLGTSLTEPNAFTGCQKLLEIENHSSIEITNTGINNRVCIYKPNASEEEIANGVKTQSDIVIEDGFAYNKNNPTKLLAYVDYAKTGSVTIPDKFTYIDSYVFAYCYNLTEILHPIYSNLNDVTLGNAIFQGCTSLESISIPYIDPPSDRWGRSNSFLWLFGSMPYNAEYFDTQNEWINLYQECVPVNGDEEGDVYKIPATLRKVTIQGGTYRTYCALQNVNFLEEITFLDFESVSLDIIPKSVKIVNFPTNGKLTSINGTFAYHHNITHLIIPEGVLWVPTLGSMKSLMHITIPSTAKAENKEVFKNLPSLVQVKNNSAYIDDSYFPEGVNVYSDSEGENKIVQEGDYIYLVDEGKKTIIKYLGEETKIVLDDSVVNIAGNAFNNSSVEKITLGNAVKKIGDYAFDGSALKEINIPASLTHIGAYAFNNTPLAIEADLSNVTYIGDYAFNESQLSALTLSEETTYLGNFAFAGTNISSLVIPNTFTQISNYAFRNCDQLENIQLSSNLEKIGISAFEGCTSLTSFTIPTTVTELGYMCINGCTSLTYLSIEFVGRYKDSSLNTTNDYKWIGYISQNLSSVKTLRVNIGGIPDGYYLLNHFSGLEKLVIGPKLMRIPSETAPYDVQYEFEEPADWTVTDRYGNFVKTITKDQCNDGFTVHDTFYYNSGYAMTKVVE